MPDITMCTSSTCQNREQCYRAWQSQISINHMLILPSSVLRKIISVCG